MRTEEEKRRFISAGTDHRNIMVEAGAGAGKTHLLVERILNQIEHEICEIQEIVAITFTRKAAEEMKERLQTELMKRSKNKPDSIVLRKALENIHRMNISTIHSFCGELIRSRPCDCGVGLEYDLLEEEDFRSRLTEFERGYMALDYVSDPELAKLISDLSLYPNLKKDFDKVLLHGDLNYGIANKEELVSQLSKLKEESLLLHEKVARLVQCGIGRDKFWKSKKEALAKDAIYWFSQYEQTKAGENYRSYLHAMEELVKEGIPKSSYDSSELKNAIIILKSKNEDVFPLEMDLLSNAVHFFQQRKALEYSVCVWAICEFKEYYMVKNRMGATALSNSELLYYAMKVVEKEDARQYFQQRYRRFYIDEFQDTDPIQARLFLTLSCENCGDLDNIEIEKLQLLPGRLFVVGDPKQSIYRFRGADLNVYNRVKAIFKTQETADFIELHRTYRYHDGLGSEIFAMFQRTKEDSYGFGPGSPSGIDFAEIETMWKQPTEGEMRGLYTVRCEKNFMEGLEAYFLRLNQRLLEYGALMNQVTPLMEVYRSTVTREIAKLFVKRFEKVFSLENSAKYGKGFRKDYLEKVWALLRCHFNGENKSEMEESEYPSLSVIEDRGFTHGYHSFFTCLELLRLRLIEERTGEEEAEILFSFIMKRAIEEEKWEKAIVEYSLLVDILKHGVISEIPEAVQRSVLRLVAENRLAGDGGAVPVKLGDILILTRNKEMLSQIGILLRNSGIPYYSTEARVFGDYPSISSLRVMAEWMESFSTKKLLRVLSTCYGWTPTELNLFQTESETCQEEVSCQEDSFLTLVGKWQRGVRKLALRFPTFVRREAEFSELLRVLSLGSETISTVGMENPLALLETMLLNTEILLHGIDPCSHEGADNITLAYLFLQMVRDGNPVSADQVADRIRILLERTVERQFQPDVQEDALRLMNLHKAKGLEGKIVLLVGEADISEKAGAFIDSQTNRGYLEFTEARDSGGWNRKKISYENSLLPEEEIENVKQLSIMEAREEKIRLDYVALTRAREAILVIDPAGTYERALNKAKKLQVFDLSQKSVSYDFVLERTLPQTPIRQERYDFVGGVLVRTPSDIEARDISLHGSEDDRPTGAEFGIIVHRTFERMIRARMEHKSLEMENALRLGVEDYLNGNELTISLVNLMLMGEVSMGELRRMGKADRIQFVFERLKEKTLLLLEQVWNEKICPLIARASKVYTELPFVFAVPADSELGKTLRLYTTDGGTPETLLIRGKMDLLMKMPKDEYLICDFKTNVKTKGMSQEAFRASLEEKYRYQMKLYRMAIENIYGVAEEKVRVLILDLYEK